MKLLFALLGVGFALAAQSSLLPTRTFNANKEYRYRYDGVVSSGLPISQEGSITHLDADVTIQFTSPRSAVMQMKNIRLSASHAISGQDLPKWESLENREVSPEHKKTLEMPVAFSYREGLVSELQFTSEEQHWSANIKRAVLNMLQMNQNQPAEEGEQEFFTTPEKTLEGECDVAYSITQEGGRTIVSKSVNFEKCSRTPEAIYGRRFSKKATDHKVFIPQTVYTYKFDKEELKEISVRSIYEVLLKDEPVMQTEVNARLTLSEVAEIREQLETPTGKPEDIMYSNGYEIDVEKFFKGGEKLVESPFKGFTTKIERATEIVNKLKEMKDSDAEMVHEMARLVRIFRMCSAEELEKIHNQLFKEAPTNTKAIIENALAIAGTKNTVEHILTHIKDNEITPMRAAQLFKSIQETHYPSEEIATMIAEFADSEQARAEPVLRQSAWLCFGSVVRGIIGHREEKHLFDQSSHDLKKKFVDIMEDNLDKAADTYEKILALKTIANSGLTMAIRTLEKIVSDRRQPVIVRVEAIQAMRIMSQHMPRKIHRVLMPIFADRKEKTEVRAAAFERIIYTLPDQAIIAQIMNIIERDPNQPLAHFAFTFLKAVDSTEFVAEERMVTDIQMALKRTTFRPKTNYMSFYQHLSLYNKQWLSGIHFNIASVLGKDSIVPKDMAVNLESLVFGRWNQYLGQIGLSHQNIEQLLRKVYDKFERESSVVRGERGQKRVEEAMHMVKSIARKMNISLRKESKETPFAMLYIRYKDMDYAVLPIDDETLDRALEYVRDGEDKIDLEKLVERLLNGKAEFDFVTAGFLFETTIRAPCTLGLPITLTSKMPTVFTSTGKVSTERPTYGGRIRLQGKLSMTSTQVYQMRIWVPLLEHGVKVVRPTRLALPLDMDLEITMKQKLSVNLRMATPEEKQELVQMSAHPIAFLRFPDPQDMNKFIDMEEHTIVIPGWERKMRPIHKNIEIGGVSFSLTGNGYKHWTAKEYFIGEQDYQLSAERTERGPKDVTFSAEIGYYSDVTIEKASLVNREEPRLEGEERVRDLIKEMSQENKKGYSLEIQGTVQTNEKSTFRLVAKTDKSWRYSRINTDLSLPTSDDNTWKWDQQIEVILPRPVKSLDSLKDKQRAAHIVALTKWGSSDKNEILSKAILEQDPELTNWIRSNRKEMSGVEEYELLVKASVLNKMNVASKYALTQESELFFDNIFDLIRGYGFWNSKVARHEGKKNHVNIEMVVEPMTRRCTNITVDTPKIRLIERNLWMPVRIPLIPMVQLSKVSKTSVKNVVSKPAECKVSESKIRSFDNVVYSAPLTKCFSVVAKDCSEKASYAVLVKKASGSSKVLKVVSEDSEVVFEVQGGQMRITRDKNPVKAEELEQMNIELVTPKMVVVDLEDVIVRFDGKVVKVQSSPSQMGIQCGLCGHYDGDMSEVFRTANDESTEDIEKFHRSYLLQDGECEMEEDLLSKKKEYRMFEENYENESRSEDYSESD